jgi:hypothetical protein
LKADASAVSVTLMFFLTDFSSIPLGTVLSSSFGPSKGSSTTETSSSSSGTESLFPCYFFFL